MSLRVKNTEILLANLDTRLPFRYGIAQTRDDLTENLENGSEWTDPQEVEGCNRLLARLDAADASDGGYELTVPARFVPLFRLAVAEVLFDLL